MFFTNVYVFGIVISRDGWLVGSFVRSFVDIRSLARSKPSAHYSLELCRYATHAVHMCLTLVVPTRQTCPAISYFA